MRSARLIAFALLFGCTAVHPFLSRPDASAIEPGGCALSEIAFCETFDVAYPGGRAGDLDEARWSVARWGHRVGAFWERAPASTQPDRILGSSFCGAAYEGITSLSDVRVCGSAGSSQLAEVLDDYGALGVNAFRAQQPFDFAGRTGTLTWRVDATANPYGLGHGWWIAVWITESPAPMPYHRLDELLSYPARGIGFVFGAAGCPESEAAIHTGLERVVIVRGSDDAIEERLAHEGFELPGTDQGGCIEGANDRLNRFELRISTDRAEIWATDLDDPTTFRLRAAVADLRLPFTRGYVHFEHVQYQSGKDGRPGCLEGDATQCPASSHVFHWDDIGFDGPVLAPLRSTSIADPIEPATDQSSRIGWLLGSGASTSLVFEGVDPSGAASGSLDFLLSGEWGRTLEYTLNGHAHTFVTPPATVPDSPAGVRGYSLEVPLEEVVPGRNTLSIRVIDPGLYDGVGSVDLSLHPRR